MDKYSDFSILPLVKFPDGAGEELTLLIVIEVVTPLLNCIVALAN